MISIVPDLLDAAALSRADLAFKSYPNLTRMWAESERGRSGTAV